MNKISRRVAIVSGAAAVGGALYAIPVARGMMEPCKGWEAAQNQAAEAMRRIGQAWLDKGLGADAVFQADLQAMSQNLSRVEDPEEGAAITKLEAQIKSDFDTGKVECCEGWVLARTELLLCVLLCSDESLSKIL